MSTLQAGFNDEDCCCSPYHRKMMVAAQKKKKVKVGSSCAFSTSSSTYTLAALSSPYEFSRASNDIIIIRLSWLLNGLRVRAVDCEAKQANEKQVERVDALHGQSAAAASPSPRRNEIRSPQESFGTEEVESSRAPVEPHCPLLK
ncbi:hypothetical protein Q8A73_022658 [Channa argus]|nr:hypothetical protein Q8A73_022658 [Channa argus]